MHVQLIYNDGIDQNFAFQQLPQAPAQKDAFGADQFALLCLLGRGRHGHPAQIQARQTRRNMIYLHGPSGGFGYFFLQKVLHGLPRQHPPQKHLHRQPQPADYRQDYIKYIKRFFHLSPSGGCIHSRNKFGCKFAFPLSVHCAAAPCRLCASWSDRRVYPPVAPPAAPQH